MSLQSFECGVINSTPRAYSSVEFRYPWLMFNQVHLGTVGVKHFQWVSNTLVWLINQRFWKSPPNFPSAWTLGLALPTFKGTGVWWIDESASGQVIVVCPAGSTAREVFAFDNLEEVSRLTHMIINPFLFSTAKTRKLSKSQTRLRQEYPRLKKNFSS